MSVKNTVTRKEYEGNGIATSFAIPFSYVDKSTIVVIHIDSAGNQTTLTSDYFVDEIANVVLYPGYPSGQEPPESEQPEILPTGEFLVILRDTPRTQETDLPEQEVLEVIEKMIDKNTMIIQELGDDVGKSNEIANEAKEIAEGIDAKANQAIQNSNTAITTANEAKSIAEGIDAKATLALSNSSTAINTANEAKETSDNISATASAALNNANQALVIANEAKDTADSVDGKATTALSNSEEALETALANSKSWKASTSYSEGQIVFTSDNYSSIALECIVAGTSGTVEPSGNIMDAVIDGSVTWGIFDIRFGRPEIDNTPLLKNWSSAKNGYKVPNGGNLCLLSELPNKFPLLNNFINDLTPDELSDYMISESEWNSLSTAANGVGGVPYFCTTSDGYIRLPDVRDMYFRASGTYNVRSFHGDAIRNFTAQIGMHGGTSATNISSVSGAASSTSNLTSYRDGGTVNTGANSRAGFIINPSLQVPTGSENVPKTIVELPVIFVGYEEV